MIGSEREREREREKEIERMLCKKYLHDKTDD